MHSRQFILFFQEQNAWSGHNLFYHPKRTFWLTYSLTVGNWYWRNSNFSNTLSYFFPGQPSFFSQLPQPTSTLCSLLTNRKSHRFCPSFIINQPAFAEQAAVPGSGLHEKKQIVLVAGLAEWGAWVPSELGPSMHFRGSEFCQHCCHHQVPFVLK